MNIENGLRNIADTFWNARDKMVEIFSRNGIRSASGGFDAAQVSAIFNDWANIIHSINQDLKAGHNKIVARAREAALNDGYGKKLLNAVSKNIVGAGGFTLRNKAFDWVETNTDGNKKKKKVYNTEINNKIEEAWYDWGKKKYCTVTGTESLRELDGLIVKTVARDGEIFIIKKPVSKQVNKYGFTLQLVETEYCDINYNKILPNGNYIHMGIEFTPQRKPVRYYFKESDPTQDNSYLLSSHKSKKFEADQVIHLFLKESTYQVRGISWLAPALVRMHMLHEYEKAMLVKSRIAASSGIMLETRENSTPANKALAGIPGAQKNATTGNFTKHLKAGEAFIAPAGFDVKTLDLNAPNGQEASFLETMRLGVAAGFDVAYVTASGDFKGHNYSASRMEVSQEQEGWKSLQSWYIEHAKEEIFEDWLENALLFKAIDLDPTKYDYYHKPWFYGRRWPYYKPSEEIAADVEALDNKIMTLEEILGKRGVDLLDHVQQLEYENQLFEEHGIKPKESNANSFEIVKKNGKANKKEAEDATKN